MRHPISDALLFDMKNRVSVILTQDVNSIIQRDEDHIMIQQIIWRVFSAVTAAHDVRTAVHEN